MDEPLFVNGIAGSEFHVIDEDGVPLDGYEGEDVRSAKVLYFDGTYAYCGESGRVIVVLGLRAAATVIAGLTDLYDDAGLTGELAQAIADVVKTDQRGSAPRPCEHPHVGEGGLGDAGVAGVAEAAQVAGIEPGATGADRDDVVDDPGAGTTSRTPWMPRQEPGD